MHEFGKNAEAIWLCQSFKYSDCLIYCRIIRKQLGHSQPLIGTYSTKYGSQSDSSIIVENRPFLSKPILLDARIKHRLMGITHRLTRSAVAPLVEFPLFVDAQPVNLSQPDQLLARFI